MNFFSSVIIAFVAGSFYALSYPSFLGSGWFPLLFIALPLFLWRMEEAKNLKQTLVLVFVYNLGLNVTGFYWVPATLREFGQLPMPVSWVLGIMFSLILQPHWWLYAIWKKYRPTFNWNSATGMALTAFILSMIERYMPQQFPIFAGSPWFHLAPYLSLASVMGVVVYSFMSYWIALEVVGQLHQKKFRPQVWIIFFIFMVLNIMPLGTDAISKDILKVRVVQANVGNFMKVSSENGDQATIGEINDRYRNLSLTKNGFEPELIVWPETAYPDTFFGDRTMLNSIFVDIMKATKSEMLIGGYDQDPNKSTFEIFESVFNSSILLSVDKVKTSYHKNILIPFGETLPFGPLNRQIVEYVPAVSLFAKGETPPVMETRAGFRFVTPICYEVLETDYMRDLLNQHGGNRLIINHTNDSWYGDTAEPYQHLFLSKWRALEFRLPIVRSTNTGVTSVIFADGSESRQIGIGKQGVLDVNVPLGTGEITIYQRFGVSTFILFFMILVAAIWWQEKNEIRP